MDKPPIGFVGLGIMGLPMAGHILDAGYPLTVYNRTRSKAEELGARGAKIADSPAEVAGASTVIITIVSDSPDVEEVVAGPQGVMDRIAEDSVVIDMSTISPQVERQLDEQLRAKGCTLVDAPVSGGDVGARNATLAIMAGGDKAAFDRVRPILEVMGKTITYCGPVGNGQLTKLSNQILVSVTLLGVSEAITFANKNGLDAHVMIEAVKGGAAGSWQLSNLGPKIVDRDFAPGFMVDLIQKDLRLVLESGAAGKAALPGTSLVNQLFRMAEAQGDGREGTQILAKAVEQLAGLGSS
jgi:2-hydroxy-3-oxopropionate reductase